MSVTTTTVSARINAEEAALLESLAEMEGCDRSTLIKSVLRRGIRALRLERAVDAYRKNTITLGRAAELAGLSVWDFLALMGREKLDMPYDVEEFEADLRALAGGDQAGAS